MTSTLSVGGHAHALLDLLGVDEIGRCGRAALEAEAIGQPLKRGEVAYSVRFVSMGEGVVIDLADSLMTASEGELLCESLGQRLYYLRGAEGLLITEGAAPQLCKPLSPTEMVGRRWQELLPLPELEPLVAELIEGLKEHEINALKAELEEPLVNGVVLSEGGGPLPWRGTKRPEIALYTRSSASIGVAKSLGLSLIELPQESGPYSDLEPLLGQLDELSQQYDEVIFELHQVWESTYRGDLLEKVKRIEWLDREWLGPLIDFCRQRGVPLEVRPLRKVDIRSGKFIEGDVPCFQFDSSDYKSIGCSQMVLSQR